MSISNYLKRATVLAALCFTYSGSSFAEIDGREPFIDNLFQDYLDANAPSAAAFEIRERLSNGTFVTRYRRSYGTLTNAGNSAPAPLNVLMRQASVAKPLVLIAVRRLVAEGKLSLEDEIFCALNEVPRNGTQSNSGCILPWTGAFSDSRYLNITVDHLINHRGGFPAGDAGLIPSQLFVSVAGSARTPTVADLITRMHAVNLFHEPGAEVDVDTNGDGIMEEMYSNIGYDLLAYAVGRASLQTDFITYLRFIGSSIDICRDDLRLANPLFSGRMPRREPEYYTFDNWFAANFFERPVGSILFGALVPGGDGGGVYGYQPGGGGLLMTTRAMLSFAQHFDITSGLPRTGFTWVAGGDGPGTWTFMIQNAQGRFDYAFMFNGNDPAATRDAFVALLEGEITQILATPPTENAAAITASAAYNTPCPLSFSNIEEPNHQISSGAWKYFTVSGARRVTLFNLSANVNLYVRNGTSNPTTTAYNCRPNLSGLQRESCTLNALSTYQIGVHGAQAGSFMLDVEHVSTQKIYEYNDPVLGNYPANCSRTITYSGGSGNTIFHEHRIVCPGHDFRVGVTNTSGSCTFSTTPAGSYTAEGACNNWRAYSVVVY